jgi:hypothetical protein
VHKQLRRRYESRDSKRNNRTKKAQTNVSADVHCREQNDMLATDVGTEAWEEVLRGMPETWEEPDTETCSRDKTTARPGAEGAGSKSSRGDDTQSAQHSSESDSDDLL